VMSFGEAAGNSADAPGHPPDRGAVV
jgi:hypothetical protein